MNPPVFIKDFSTLRLGDSGDKVLLMQQYLKKHSFYTTTPSGLFDDETLKAVVKFQTHHGLEPDGVPGKQTLYLLYYLEQDASKEWRDRALAITAYFETSGRDPFSSLTGDFDGMVISCGMLQVNIGSGSLQKLVKRLGEVLVKAKMPIYGKVFWEASNKDVPNAKRLIRETMLIGKEIKTDAKAELKALLSTPESKKYQLEFIRGIAVLGFAGAKEWSMASRNSPAFTIEEFCWFFDLATLNGDLKGITYNDVKQFRDNHQSIDNVRRAIYDWMINYPTTVIVDGKVEQTFWKNDVDKNIAIWKAISLEEIQLTLFILTRLRADKSRLHFKLVTMIRKGAIVTGQGFVNGNNIRTKDLPLIAG